LAQKINGDHRFFLSNPIVSDVEERFKKDILLSSGVLSQLGMDTDYLSTRILSLDVEDVLNYLDEVSNSQATKTIRKKVCLIGPPEAGKTSLKKCLLNIKPLKQEQRTVGVDVDEWNLKKKISDKEMDCYIGVWDFAGQNEFQEVHQIFFSEETLFLLVFDLSVFDSSSSSQSDTLSTLQHLKHSVEQRLSKYHQMILVGTHLDKLNVGNKNERATEILEEMSNHFFALKRLEINQRIRSHQGKNTQLGEQDKEILETIERLSEESKVHPIFASFAVNSMDGTNTNQLTQFIQGIYSATAL
jgi:small GTP-binding protein